MMKFNILPAVRTDRKDEKGFAPIYIKVYEGKRVVSKFSIGYKVKPEDFAEDTRRVKKSVGNASLINSLSFGQSHSVLLSQPRREEHVLER
jgi:hypothetical protein